MVKILDGTVASEGNRKGEAVILKNFENIPDLKDKIVVLKEASTDIAEHIFNAAGIISETGGMLCHLAIVAREFNIPLIFAKNATEIIKEKDIIEIITKGSFGEVIKNEQQKDVECSKVF